MKEREKQQSVTIETILQYQYGYKKVSMYEEFIRVKKLRIKQVIDVNSYLTTVHSYIHLSRHKFKLRFTGVRGKMSLQAGKYTPRLQSILQVKNNRKRDICIIFFYIALSTPSSGCLERFFGRSVCVCNFTLPQKKEKKIMKNSSTVFILNRFDSTGINQLKNNNNRV